MRRGLLTLAIPFALAALSTSLACREEGPAERFGRAFDEAASDFAEAVSDGVEAVGEGAEAAIDAAEETADRIRKEAGEAPEAAHEPIDDASG